MSSQPPDPRNDPWFIGLRGIAMRGGDRGPLYDQGVLSVIEQIERTGRHVPSLLKGLGHLAERDPLRAIYTPDEIAALERELAVRGWTIEQGAQFAKGVSDAEEALKAYRLDTNRRGDE
jgi:hypothetical protein